MNSCPNCGESIVEGSMFCMNCGHSIQKPAPGAEQQPISGDAQQAQQAVAPPIAPQAQQAAACPNCGAPFAPGTLFCMGCGHSLQQAPLPSQQPQPHPSQQPQPSQQTQYQQTQTYSAPQPPPMPAAPAPAPAPAPAQATAQATAAAPAAPGAPAAEEQPKKKSSLIPIIIIAAAALLVIAAVVFVLGTGIISFGAKPARTDAYLPSGSYIAYLKDNELNIANPKAQAFFEASADLLSGETFRTSLLSSYYGMTSLVQITKNGSRLFYPDRIISDSSYNLFSRTISGNGKTPGEAFRLDTDIRGEYRVSEDGKIVYYVRGDAKSFYSHNLKERGERIASDVTSFIINSSGARIYYTDSESNIYFRNKNSSTSEKVDSESSFIGTSPDFAYVYYTKDETLYRKKIGETKEKIASGVNDVIKFYDSGEFYYTKEVDIDDKTIDVLCYYDGSSETKIGSNLDYRYSLAICGERPVLVYLIRTTNDDESEYRIAIKGKEYAVDISKTFRSPQLNEAGTKLYYIDDYNETRQYGDLWIADVTDDGLRQAAHLYEDVNSYSILSKGAVRYFSELNKAGSAADMYIDGKSVDTDVLINSDVEIAKTGNLLYYTDYNSNRDRGTLNICVGNKPAMVADDVAMFGPLTGATAVYLVVEGSSSSGDIYYYDGSKERKRVDTDAVLIMPILLTGAGGKVNVLSGW